MPRPPKPAPAVAAMPESVFSPVESGARDVAGRVYPLHVGDTWMEPFEGARMQDLAVEQHPGMHRYCATQGIPELLDAVIEKVRARNRLACEPENALVTGGATGGLASLLGALAAPGEEGDQVGHGHLIGPSHGQRQPAVGDDDRKRAVASTRSHGGGNRTQSGRRRWRVISVQGPVHSSRRQAFEDNFEIGRRRRACWESWAASTSSTPITTTMGFPTS